MALLADLQHGQPSHCACCKRPFHEDHLPRECTGLWFAAKMKHGAYGLCARCEHVRWNFPEAVVHVIEGNLRAETEGTPCDPA